MKISIVIPAYNEEATITELIGRRTGMPPFSFKLSCGCRALAHSGDCYSQHTAIETPSINALRG